MKKFLLVLVPLFFLFSGCKFGNSTVNYIAKVHIPLGSSARYVFTKADVDKFKVYLSGHNLYGEQIDKICTDKDSYYLDETDEIVVNIEEPGFYSVQVYGYTNHRADYYYICYGSSSSFIINENEEITIIIPIYYNEIKPRDYNMNYIFEDTDITNITVNTVIFRYYSGDDTKANFEYVLNYVKNLKSKNEKWWLEWNEEDFDSRFMDLHTSTEEDFIRNESNLTISQSFSFDGWSRHYDAFIIYIEGELSDGTKISKQISVPNSNQYTSLSYKFNFRNSNDFEIIW